MGIHGWVVRMVDSKSNDQTSSSTHRHGRVKDCLVLVNGCM